MKNEPIFELFRDPQENTDSQRVKIYVSWNGKRTPLIDVLKIFEEPCMIDDVHAQPGGYNWPWADTVYEKYLEYKNNEYPAWEIFWNGPRFHVVLSETQTQVILKRVFPTRTFSGVVLLDPAKDEHTWFHTFPKSPEFVFDKAQFYEELGSLRLAYEEKKRRDEEYDLEYERSIEMNQQWDEETLKNDSIDYTAFRVPKYSGPIFQMVESGDNILAEIYVDWQGKRTPLIDVVKIWETPFEEKRPGDYRYRFALGLYYALVVEDKHEYPFHDILACGGCGNTGCWPFQVVLKETDDLVFWTNFRQPHRNKYSLGGFWDFTKYPPFVFDKKQYYEELEQMRPEYEKYKEMYNKQVADDPDGNYAPLTLVFR